MLKEFKEFISRGNLVELAVAVVLGLAFTAVVQALVIGVFTPLVAAIFGKSDISVTFQIGEDHPDRVRDRRAHHVPDHGVRAVPDREGLQPAFPKDEAVGPTEVEL